ncbi:MAG TPA: hypothetical protein H9871_02105 [Candidatus Nesterenkonia stercoripullorum]|uniref:Phage head morphogenesis domain-containing protein n=1 Tax=Candidatus Nesterenkonia stercoripullorum TaxID=2838701 RepID=A0A9D1S2S4_9MICC|nr:hypothetical protein [Candidatus Nesterenkonia stercoripullorum]
MRNSLGSRVVASASGAIAIQDDWFNLSSTWDTARGIADIVDSGVRQEAAITQSYMAQVYGAQGITPNEPALAIRGSLRTGSTTALSYRRLASDMRYLLTNGEPEQVALGSVFRRLEQMVTDDLAMGMREQSRRFIMANGRTTRGFRRVIRPEMSTSGTCGLCMVASDNVYGRADLLPIHNRCRCIVSPITKDHDPGDLNKVDLEAIYAAAGSTQAKDLINVRVRDVEHGELGPRIVPADAPGEADYKGYLRNRVPRWEQPYAEALSNAEKQIIDIEARIASRTERPDDHKWLDANRKSANKARTKLQQLYTSRANLAEMRAA